MNDRGVTTNSGAMVDDQVLEEFEATLRGEVICLASAPLGPNSMI
jgi:hypothetical protein